MKKVKRGGVHMVDERLPGKPPAPPAGARVRAVTTDAPAYEGVKKTDKSPSRRGAEATGPTKAAYKPGDTVQRPRTGSTEMAMDDQIPAKTRRPKKASAAPEQYIRMRIRVRGDRLSVIDSHLVDGPLGQTQGFSGPNIYEVTVDDRLLHAGSLPDLGMQRSFVNPAGPVEQQGHHFTDRTTYEFTARVAAAEVTPETISRIAVRVHRAKDEARTDRLGSAPLAHQFPREIRQVAELVGLPASVLPAAIEDRGGRTPSI